MTLKSVTQWIQNVNCAQLQCWEGVLQGMLFNLFHSDINTYLLHLHKLDHFRNWIIGVLWNLSFPSYYSIINMPVRFCIRIFFNGLALYLALWDKTSLILIFFSIQVCLDHVWTCLIIFSCISVVISNFWLMFPHKGL